MSEEPTSRKRNRRRWGDAVSAPAPAPAPKKPDVVDSKAKALALQASIQARLAALKAKTALPIPPKAAPIPVAPSASAPAPATKRSALASSTSSAPTAKRAKHYELDMSVTAPTFNANPASTKPKVNPYLAHTAKDNNAEGEAIEEEGDERLERAGKIRSRHKALNFIEPGLFTEIAERKRLKAANAEESGFVSGRKTGMYFRQTKMENIYGTTDVLDDDVIVAPRPEAQEKTTIPYVVEWWDMELLPNKLKKQVAAYEGKVLSKEAQSQMQQLESTNSATKISSLVNPEVEELTKKCAEHAALSYCKTAALVQHIVPIKPLNAKAAAKQVEPILYLTKKERKRQRKLRRQEKQRELQDLQAAGLVEPPEPRLTLTNFIRVLGDQAFVDPSQMEQKVLEQVQARQRAHLERNAQNKLTKEQRAEKRARKMQEDTAKTGIHVALFYVKDMSHPYHRTKVDLNAQQFNITGGVLECENPALACVICEGGPKAIKRYTRLMTVRMKWKGPDDNAEESDDDDEEEEAEDGEGVVRHKFHPENKCGLVWTGIATKRFFKGFIFQSCETSDQAKKVLRAKGVGHFWDQVLTHASGREEAFQLKLADSTDEDEDDDHQDVPVKMEED
jgi:U4/U6 small nuclear ribonucleoprotein PRP3